ncbi:alpha-ketoglutarate-dependent dioxygenase AlkB [Formosa sp. L2A11]|uniref:alpha-ketoglutarate-dependent dioxygenase AlkB family protein n=1 Tax=Formosa sp. L2A11 TaxID=2686363 RepID=UPI001E2B53EC|nr:alpha-ketoglutarate-dependent dioxygenase AlkB [Formosa sp. L2A11]
MKDAEVIYFPEFFSPTEADQLYNSLLNSIAWQQDNISLFGKTHPQPRLTALYGNNEKPYTYSGIQMKPNTFSETLLDIKIKIETETHHKFTSCLCNLYRDGQDSNGWHADNEKELGTHPVIASISFGAERIFHLKHKEDNSLKQKLTLNHGSLLLMKGETQQHWLHQIPKTKKKIGKRINLTFRTIY